MTQLEKQQFVRYLEDKVSYNLLTCGIRQHFNIQIQKAIKEALKAINSEVYYDDFKIINNTINELETSLTQWRDLLNGLLNGKENS